MIADEKLNELMIASLPSERRWVAWAAYDYADKYIKNNNISWERAYGYANEAFARDSVKAANDEVPFQQAVMTHDFGGDKGMAASMYVLFPLYTGAKAIAASLLAKRCDELSAYIDTIKTVRPSVQNISQATFVGAQAKAHYCSFLEHLGIGGEVAKQSARTLEASLEDYIFQGDKVPKPEASR